MKTELAIIGQGAVTPAGVGVAALLHGKPTETMVRLVSRPDRQWPVYKIDLKDAAFHRWQKEPRLRRASPLSFFLVEAAEQALVGVSEEDRARTGLIIAFSTGCLAYSRRLFEGIITQGQKTASPALFPETVFNSPVSHVASTLRLEGAAYALAGDEVGWIAALKTAALWLEQERVAQVLVLGAEEFDSASLDAWQSAGWLRNESPYSRFIPSEGAGGVLIRKCRAEDAQIITQLEDGFIYSSKTQATAAAHRCLQKFDSSTPAFPTALHNWLAKIEVAAISPMLVIASEKQTYLGDASTASAAWNTIRTLNHLNETNPQILVPVWGTNHQVGALELKNRAPSNI